MDQRDRNPLDDLPKIDPRTPLVAKAEAEIGLAVSELAYKHQLTYAELIQILAQQIDRWAQRQVCHDRGERRDSKADQ